jgi:hypothetical protein
LSLGLALTGPAWAQTKSNSPSEPTVQDNAALGKLLNTPYASRPGKRPTQTNPVQRENAKTDGVSAQWRIDGASHAVGGEIAGYAMATSVNRGGVIDLHVNVADVAGDPNFHVDVYRMGFYGGVGARRIMPRITLPSLTQSACSMVDVPTRMVECDWQRSLALQIPTDPSDATVAMSGFYLAKLTTTRGMSSFIPFVVRDDARVAAFMFQASFSTYQAYNTEGGYSFYTAPADAAFRRAAYKVSFNRPFQVNNGWGAGQFFLWEFNAVRFLEREGYDVVYSTNLDTHTNPQRLLDFRAFLSVGHDEYWTREMYDAKEIARNGKVNLAFLGANTGYWQVRLESDAAGRPNRRMVGYRYWPENDPYNNTSQATVQWRQLNRSEAGLVGVQYDHDPVDGDIHIVNCPRWFCRGTTVGAGSVLPGILGYEVDQVGPATPPGTTIIARSPYVVNGQTRLADMTYYTHSSGAGVFASGSMQWNWGLDDHQMPWITTPPRVNANVQQMTRNLLDRFMTLPVR